MICGKCGSLLSVDAQYCVGCDTKVGETQTAAAESKMFELAPRPLGLPTCNLSIDDVTAEPDSDNEVSLNVKFTVTNNTAQDWRYFRVLAQVLRGDGVPLGEDEWEHDGTTIVAGASKELETSLRFDPKYFGKTVQAATVLLSFTAYGAVTASLDQFDVPIGLGGVVRLKPIQLGDQLRLISGALWNCGSDMDRNFDTKFQVECLVQNLTAEFLPEVCLLTRIDGKAKRAIMEEVQSHKLVPGEVRRLFVAGHTKKSLKDAKAAVSISAYYPLATGHCQKDGIDVQGAFGDQDLSDSDTLEKSTAHNCSISVDFGSWTEIQLGELPKKAVDRILSGDDFDDALADIFGDHPDSLSSMLPNREWVFFGKTLKDVDDQAARSKEVTRIEWEGREIEPVIRLILSDDVELPEGASCACKIESLLSTLSDAAADQVADLWRQAMEVKLQLANTIDAGKSNKKSVFWARMNDWKGCSAEVSTEYVGEAPPNVTCVYFLFGEILPRIADLTGEDGESVLFSFVQDPLAGYLACVIVGDEVLVPDLSDDRDTGVTRWIIDYRKGREPVGSVHS